MAWIKIVSNSEGGPELRAALEAQRALFPPDYQPSPGASTDGDATGIVATHTLIPKALEHAFSTFGALMSPDLPLERRQHEMIATMVSVTNRCAY